MIIMNKQKRVIPHFHAFEFEPGIKENSFYLSPPDNRTSALNPKIKPQFTEEYGLLTYRYDPKTGKYTRSDNKKVI